MDKVNLVEKLALIHERWRPKVVGALNGQEVKLAKFEGTFPWHHHEAADELFLALAGSFAIELRDRTITLHHGEFFIVPRGVEHRTVAVHGEASALLFEPAETRNTGNVEDEEFTAPQGVQV